MASWLDQARAQSAALPELVTNAQAAALREGIAARLQRRAAMHRLALSGAVMSAAVVLWLLGASPDAELEPMLATTPTSQAAHAVVPPSVSALPRPSPAAATERPPLDQNSAAEPGSPTPATGDARFERMAGDEHAQALAIEHSEIVATKLHGKRRDVVGELLVAADRARKDGRAADAASALQTLVQKHSRDPRAPSAAFSLGRVLLESQQRPADAAAAFALVAKLAPKSPLVEDALAREAEAWARAGDSVKAQAVARRYLERYPAGARAAMVRTLAKLD